MRLIDVDALIDDVVDRYCKDCKRRKGIKRGEYRIIYEIGEAPCRACGVGDMLGELEDAPTVNVHDTNVGKWLYGESESGHDGYYCSQCGEHIRWRYGEEDIDFIKSYNYCPNCGAKMDKDEWEEPEINPCRGCLDYGGRGGCKSNGGCGAEMDEVEDGEV